MDILTLMEKRYSVRDFSDVAVKDADIEKILESARLAPSAKNLEPYKIIVVKSEEALQKLRAATRNAYNAPVVFVICANKEECWERNDGWKSADTDAAIVCDHMMLTATSLGLGSVWACWFDEKSVREALKIDQNLTPISLLPVGYPSDTCAPSERHTQRKPLTDTVEYR